MLQKHSLPTLTLLLLISFASVNAVLFTPALPDIAAYFNISSSVAGLTVTWFLVGYTFGQLIYGPLANRYGRKPTLLAGILLQILSCILCSFAGHIHFYDLLVLGRFLSALGAGVGLKMTFTLVTEVYDEKIATQKISFLFLAFAITPGLSVALGGVMNSHFGWASCFYSLAVYGCLLLFLCTRLPETHLILDLDALKLDHLIEGYLVPLRCNRLISASLIMGCATAIVYIFAALAPFIAIDTFGMTSMQYGLANLIPPIGMILGSLTSAYLTKFYPPKTLIGSGLIVSAMGILMMAYANFQHFDVIVSLFMPMIIIYFGLSLLIGNSSSIAMCGVKDKAHASAVMNFINMGFGTIAVLSMGLFTPESQLLPQVYLGLSCIMIFVYVMAIK
jgi:MFS transporter, DHA1 family, multidrug resistance protein